MSTLSKVRLCLGLEAGAVETGADDGAAFATMEGAVRLLSNLPRSEQFSELRHRKKRLPATPFSASQLCKSVLLGESLSLRSVIKMVFL
ncbi:hypothetical protein [Deinococcus marmoris]|uniref:hypothetical protein n=1 Tax=Deinococcus marmoris TaxID=249408 RepID=UPI00158A738F|nr:hypothetical protein [Deinococcus marmoris]